ncbi:Lsr2 family DNA-binding protein [Streptomyces malaysiensis]|uniref:Lsr2 family DNA-binding protein n=1 Tax=Streptomyces malaysiensis TaxID=92644 RepID=UPI000853242A|nr:histone-like nucleoid-structuring protein Lsr2 [Streptomyces sp. SPMA113]
MITGNPRDTALAMLKEDKTADEIAEVTGLSEGEIAAIAQTEELTQHHAKQRGRAYLSALAWALKSDSAKIRTKAERVKGDLDDLVATRQKEIEAQEARAQIESLENQLATARAKLRYATTGKKSPLPSTGTDSKKERDKIRAWARSNGYEVSDRGVISNEIRNAWNNRDQAQDG